MNKPIDHEPGSTGASRGRIRVTASLPILTVWLASAAAAGGSRREVGEKVLLLNKKPVFLSGVNYVPSMNWHLVLDQWDEPAVDRDLAALKAIGIGCIRFFPLLNCSTRSAAMRNSSC